MPRRKKPIQRYANGKFDLKDRSKLVGEITVFLSDYKLIQFTSAQIRQMSQTIAKTNCDLKKLGLDLLISGKRTRPHAWQLDIFCSGLAKAWRNAKLEPGGWEWGDKKSSFVQFAEDLAVFLEIEHPRKFLRNNVIRGLKIKRS
jgi:hypothetical protein